ncbi:hypothetical protein SANA_19030 [Gottschalkiaceae bacterium SANA]|nr:hypothetical protein SANA_19030 [Gottschalkiaceae bacterium SANA]
MKIGLRNIKTAVAVSLCIILFQLLDRPYPFYACIAAVICMQRSVEHSFRVGRDRMIGTILGGLIGLGVYLVFGPVWYATGLGIVVVIALCNYFGKQSSVAIACIVLIAITTNLKEVTAVVYAANRVMDTLIGIVIALGINRLIPSRKPIVEGKTS